MQEEVPFDLSKAIAIAKSGLNVPAPARGQPCLVMLCGLPGTGKSTIAAELAHQLPAVVIESDRVRQRLFAPPAYTADESSNVHRVCHTLMSWYLRHYYHVIYDATNLYEYHRQLVYRLAERSGGKLVVVEVTANDEVVRNRLEPRQNKVQSGCSAGEYSDANWDVYLRMSRRAEPIERPHITVDTSDSNLARAVKQVLEAITNQ